MNKSGIGLSVALVCVFASQAVLAQEQGQKVTPSWTVSTVSAQGQPRGFVEYQKYCSACHGAGAGHPGTLALQAKYKGALPALLDQRTDLTAPLIKTYVRNGLTVMPSFRKTEISDAELDSTAAYLTRNNKP